MFDSTKLEMLLVLICKLPMLAVLTDDLSMLVIMDWIHIEPIIHSHW